MKQCKVAYTRAKLDEVESNQPDFLYNYSNLLQFEEEYQQALECLKRANLMDPKWTEPLERWSSIIKSLVDVNQMVHKKSSLKPKRIQSLAAEIKTKGDQMLGAFLTEPELKSKYSLKAINQLVTGENKGILLHLKVIGAIQHQKSVCITIVCIDGTSEAVALSIYNLGKEPKIEDSIVLSDPIYSRIKLTTDDGGKQIEINYPNIRIDNPQRLVVNGRLIPTEVLTKPRVANVRSHD